MTRRDIDNPEQLLSAYADDGLTADEQRAVDAYLDGNPAERAELEHLRDTLREVKALSPSVRDEPAWGAMTAAISREIDIVEAERDNTLGNRFWRWFRRPGVIAGFGTAAVAAGAIAFFVMRDGGAADTQPTGDQIASIDTEPTRSLIRPAPGPDIASDLDTTTDLDDMDEDELDAMLASFTLEGDDDNGDDVFGDLLIDDDLLSDDALVEWTAEDEGPSYTSGLGVDMFDEPEYDWLDELDEDQIDALDRYLDSIQAG